MNQKKIIVIVGNSGSGKTTISQDIAKQCDFACLSEDQFVFDMNPGSLIERKARKQDREIGMQNLLSVLQNYLKNNKSVIIEGAFVDPPIYLQDLAKIAEKNNYIFIPIMLLVERKVSVKRKKKKPNGYIVPERIDAYLRQSADKLEYQKICSVIDTSKAKYNNVVLKIKELIGT